MDWYWYWLIFFFILILPTLRSFRLRQVRTAKRNRMRRIKGEHIMNELVNSYINKEVIIYTNYSSGVTGTVTKIEDNWVEIKDKNGNRQILNTDYISRIQEYPRNKNGKKKAVIV